jgi:hypothetical protein
MRAAQPSDITELPSTAGIWLDMGAPILLPDVIKGMDPLIVASTYTTSGDPAVFKKYIESYTSTLLEFIKTHPSDTSCFVYPTMDYYMSAMKLAFVATNLDRPIHTQFSKEGTIYKNILKKLENLQNTPAYSNEYFALMSMQSLYMYKYMKSNKTLQTTIYNEKLWLGAYDVFIRFIVDFRLHYDVRFQRIVYFIKEKNKRLIYTSNDSANQPFRTRIGNMIASIINDLTLDSLQFVYDETEIAAHATIAAAITPAIEVMPAVVPAPVPAALPEIIENPPAAAAPVLAYEPVAATSIAAAPVLAYEPVAAAPSAKKGLSKGLSKGSLKKP